MVFSSLSFLYVFLPLLLIGYFIIPGRGKNIVLLLFSILFYFYGEPEFLWLLIFFCLFNFAAGLALERTNSRRTSRVILAVGMLVDFGWLFYFKYMDFFIGVINDVSGLHLPLFRVVMPVGISFFTFQTVAYVIDVYLKKTAACKNILDFSTYVCLFPQLVAGPIVRYQDIQKQLKCRNTGFERFADGMCRFSIGLGKKVLIANNLGAFCGALEALKTPSVMSGWLLALGYILWLYFDFSGYSDMAIGLGHIFGFDFPENFNYPLISGTVTEFWRRWHMTLSSWFKDYVYIPLGGSRCGKLCQFRNILIVWMLTGLWHGAGWQFILWGLIFALCLMAEKAGLYGWFVRHKAAGHLYVVLVLMISFVIFQSPALGDAIVTLKAMGGFLGTGVFEAEVFYILRSYAVILAVSIIGAMPLFSKLKEKYGSCGWLWYLRAAACMMILILCTAYLTDATYNPFLYFRF